MLFLSFGRCKVDFKIFLEAVKNFFIIGSIILLCPKKKYQEQQHNTWLGEYFNKELDQIQAKIIREW